MESNDLSVLTTENNKSAYCSGSAETKKPRSSLTVIETVAGSPKLVTMNSADVDSPGAASILDDVAVTSTEVEAGVNRVLLNLLKTFPPGKRFWNDMIHSVNVEAVSLTTVCSFELNIKGLCWNPELSG